MRAWRVSPADIGWLTNAVQVGFVVGTLVLALSGMADRICASMIFAVGAVAGALLNTGFALGADGLATGLVLRFLEGLCLAGILPTGMKLILLWEPERSGLIAGVTTLFADVGLDAAWILLPGPVVGLVLLAPLIRARR